MVDTDRYEGHTPGPWHFCIGYDPKTDMYGGPSPLKGGGDRVNGPVILSDYQFERGTAGHKADLKLIEDAPLLLDAYKWLERVESYFLADGSFNHDADFVRMCAENDKYGYRIEVIDGVETVVHESEY